LEAIASNPSYVSIINAFDSSQFDALQTIIVNEACTTSAEVEINETVDTSVGEDETTYIEVPYDSDEGVTIKINVTNGTVTVYASDQTTTPNEAFYDWMIETGGYSDVFLDPDAVNRTIGDTVYVAIEGQEPDNDFTFVSEEGNTTVGLCSEPCDSYEVCRIYYGEYKCVCQDGFYRNDEGYCEDIDECETYCQEEYITNCSNFVGGYLCTCYDDYFYSYAVDQCISLVDGGPYLLEPVILDDCIPEFNTAYRDQLHAKTELLLSEYFQNAKEP
jgi:hypothetical protein